LSKCGTHDFSVFPMRFIDRSAGKSAAFF